MADNADDPDAADEPDDLDQSDNSDNSDDSLMTSWASCRPVKSGPGPDFRGPGSGPKVAPGGQEPSWPSWPGPER